jgi:sulfonate transport system substrate-binding protein
VNVTLTRRAVLATGLAMPFVARAATTLRIGDQRGGLKSVMQAADVLQDAPFGWSVFPAASPLLEALNADAIDCGGVGDAPFAFAHASGSPIKIFAATRSTGASTAMLVHAGSPYQNFADLKGKTIATAKGSVGHYLVVAARDKAGLKPSDITIAFLSPADAGSAFANNSVDAWATWSQYVYLALAHGDARILLDGKGLMSGLSYEVATTKAIAEKHDLIADFKRRLERALRWGLAHPDEYAAAWSKETGVPLDVSKQTLKARGFTPAPIDQTVIDDQTRTVSLYVRERVLPKQTDVASGFDRSFS